MTLEIQQLGRISYTDAHARMKDLLEARIRGLAPDTLLLCEHDPVYTLGRSRGAAGNVLAPGDVPVIPVERGGDVTFHGPGQLVGYPVCALPPHRQDLHAFLHGLEDVCTRVIAHWGIEGGRDPRNTGVWVRGQKIAAIGIACRRWVSWHGFALNLSTDLGFFRRINPCGMDSELVTRMVDHLREPPSMEELSEVTASIFHHWWARFTAPPEQEATSAPTG